MAKLLMRPPTPGDIVHLAQNMRPCDVREVEAATGRDPLTVVKRSVALSHAFCYSAFLDDELVCIIGVSPFPNHDAGAPWSLGTKAQNKHQKAFIKYSPSFIRDMLDIYPHLFNFVDARNTKSIRWLQRVGFTLHPAISFGVHGLPFHPFEMRI